MSQLPAAHAAAVFQEHSDFLWSLCYRMTGSAADADDLVQDTFARAIERPPADLERPWRPWLVRVAINLSRDFLRRRRRRAYSGPWLPAPIETPDDGDPPAFEPAIDGGQTTEGRYELLESVSFAFLLALEALTPQQRAVLLLRDVFDYSVEDAANALDLSASNVKTTHHRARRAMQSYDRERRIPTRSLQEKTKQALERFVSGLMAQDVGALEKLLADDVRALSDAAGEFHAARVPILGRSRVARFFTKLGGRRGTTAVSKIRLLNGMPALITVFVDGLDGEAYRVVTRCEVDGDGRIVELHSILATRKLTAVRFE